MLREGALKVLRHGIGHNGYDIESHCHILEFSMRGDEEFRRFDYSMTFPPSDRRCKTLDAIRIDRLDLDEGKQTILQRNDIQLAPAATPIPCYDNPATRQQVGGRGILGGPTLSSAARAGCHGWETSSRGSSARAMNRVFSVSRSRISPVSSL